MDDTFRQLLNKGIQWGPGLLIVFVMLYGLFLLLKGVGLKIVGALEKPSSALMTQAEALTKQSVSMERLTICLEQFVTRDQTEHREIIILQKVILDRIENLKRDQDGS